MKDRDILQKLGLNQDTQLMIFSTVDRTGNIKYEIKQPMSEKVFKNVKQGTFRFETTLKQMFEISGANEDCFAYDDENSIVVFNSPLYFANDFRIMQIINQYAGEDVSFLKQMFDTYFGESLGKENLNEQELIEYYAQEIKHPIVHSYRMIIQKQTLSMEDEMAKIQVEAMLSSGIDYIRYWEYLMEIDNVMRMLLKEAKSLKSLLAITYRFAEEDRAFATNKIIAYYLENPSPFVSNELLYEFWQTNYQFSERGFLNFKNSFEQIYNRELEPVKKRLNILKRLSDKQGYLSVYRGQTDNSTPISDALSWTLSENVASSFAYRYIATNYKLFCAKIHMDDVYDLFLSKGRLHYEELEVLVNPKGVIIEEIISIGDTYEILEQAGELQAPVVLLKNVDFNSGTYMDFYNAAQEAFRLLNRSYDLFECSDLHGYSHVSRVLFHTIIISMFNRDKLVSEDMGILIVVAILHDIGRIHDEEDDMHGIWSVKKADELGLDYYGLEGEALAIAKFIIECHNIDDKTGLKKLHNEYSISDKQRAEYLYGLFKDADGLDRVRLDDLDISYIRQDRFKLALAYAEDVLQTLKIEE